ncbi:MAG: carbohydrate kinase family protein [Candidatus Nomurabacteria bacterium]|nr:carbohydrate kinase family protein [Candidatus Nomurabacteria bacterium]
MSDSQKIDFLAIGDIVTDAFIELQDATVNCDINSDACTISMRWGDKIPYKQVTVVPAVGNGPNASVSAARLGLSSALMSHLGNDMYGNEAMETLQKNGVNTDLMTMQDGKKTNYHYVLSFNAERTILIKHEEFVYDLAKQTADKPIPTWVYFSSVGEHGLPYHREIAKWISENNIKMAFQPGTFQIKLGIEKLSDIYSATEIFFCNKDEAKRILKTKEDDIEKLLRDVQSHGPKTVIISDGPNGAYAFDGEHGWFMPMYPDPKPPIDRTGAGDSFSSTVTSYIAMGYPLSEALSRGPINSMSVVQYMGAQEGLLSKDKIEEYLSNAPDDYKVKQIF